MRRTAFLAPISILALLLLVGGATPGSAGGQKCEAARGNVLTVEGDVQKPIRIGGPVPVYPEIAKEERIEGVVVARLLIEKDGTVSEAKVVESLGEAFDAGAVEALRQWTFEPATLHDEPVRVHFHVTVRYALDGKDERGG